MKMKKSDLKEIKKIAEKEKWTPKKPKTIGWKKLGKEGHLD